MPVVSIPLLTHMGLLDRPAIMRPPVADMHWLQNVLADNRIEGPFPRIPPPLQSDETAVSAWYALALGINGLDLPGGAPRIREAVRHAQALAPHSQSHVEAETIVLDDYGTFLRAPGSGKLAGKLILRHGTIEDAERILEIFRDASEQRDAVYVDVAWAESLMAKGDERHEEAMARIGSQIVAGAYSEGDSRDAHRCLFPDGLPPDAGEEAPLT